MADLRVSELPAASGTAPSDALYLVQGGASKKITLATLFANVAGLLRTSGPVALGGTPQQLVNSGTINATATTTLARTEVASTANMAAGTQDGQLKTVILTDAAGSLTISGSTLPAGRTVKLTRAGDTCLFQWFGKWYPIGGTAVIS